MRHSGIFEKIRGGSLRDLARWLFLGTVILAPWLYGATTAWAIELIEGLLGVVLFFWTASLILDRRRPMTPRGLVIITGVILIQGWWMALNAHAIRDTSFYWFVPLAAKAPAVAGSVDYTLSFAMMVRATVLLGTIFFTADMIQRGHWLLRLWFTIAVAGGSIAFFGLVQKATRAPMIFWAPVTPWDNRAFFATFYYHANAGAYLNLVFPAVVGLTCWLLTRKQNPIARAILVATTLIVLLAIAANTSRMSQIVGGLVVVGVLATVVRPLFQTALQAERKLLLIGAAIGLIAVFAIARTSHLDQPLMRWQQFAKQFPVDARWAANRVAFGALREVGVCGFGPGTFRAVFPHYQQLSGAEPAGTWRFLHDDYLQTVLEWGWLGAFALGVLFFGGVGLAVRNSIKAEGWSLRQRLLLLCTLLALAGVASHAAVDFPLQILSIQLLVATYLGICWGSGEWGARAGGQRSEVGG